MSAGTPGWSTADGCRPSPTPATCSAAPNTTTGRRTATDAAHAAVFADSVQPVVEAGKVDLVDSDAQIADEITLIPTPGHSPGHVALHIRSDGEEALLTGDVAHHPCQMAHLDWSSTFDSDPVQSIETRRMLFSRFADTPTLVIGGHFGPGRIVRDGDAFRLRARRPRDAPHGAPAASPVEIRAALLHEVTATKPGGETRHEARSIWCGRPGEARTDRQIRPAARPLRRRSRTSPARRSRRPASPSSPRSIPPSLPAVAGQPRLGSPVGGAPKFIAIGLNYADHAAEANMPIPAEPIVFMKADELAVRAERRRRKAARLDQARLGSRARDRHRQPRQIRLRGRRAEPRRRLRGLQRRLRARLPARAGRAMDQGQVARHLRAARPVAGHQGRDRRRAQARRCGSTSTASAARPARPRR